MKQLTLVRHAKSDWSNALPDFDRPLNARGEQAAPHMAARLREHYPAPERILSSPANRALRTATLIAEGLGLSTARITTDDKLYNASPGEILKAIARIDDGCQHLMVVAHNPGMTDLANLLTDSRIDNLSTCAILGAEMDIDHWRDAGPGMGRVRYFDFPKNPHNPTLR